jgi:CubicO group peptidase (beta-lactamase class C family)
MNQELVAFGTSLKLVPLLRKLAIDALLPLLVGIGCTVHADGSRKSDESVTAKVDKLFEEWNKSDSPGCSLAVSRNGTLVYERGYGMANLELGVPITPESVFHVCSISKQFTAMSILLLAERGRLSLNDEVRKYIPELPDYGSPLTIRHLLTHTSGLRDAFLLLGLAVPRDGGDLNETIVKILSRQRGLNFTPGSQFDYNNGGYVLLGSIVKRVSGQTLRAFTEATIFKPLGMAHTHFHDDSSMIVPNRVSGYSGKAENFRVAGKGDTSGLVGNAGLFTTARDLLLWEQNFADMRVGDRALVAEMQKPTVLSGGDTNAYGFGLEIGEYRGLHTVGHGGGDRGFAAHVVRYPDQGLAIAVLCNLDSIGAAVGALTQAVADIYLADVFASHSTPAASPTTRTPAQVSLSHEQLATKVGLYRDPSTEDVGRIFIREGKLRASPNAGESHSIELTPVSMNRFVLLGTRVMVEFLPVVTGKPQSVRVTGDGPKPVLSQKVDAFAPSSTELSGFKGQYTSEELEVTYTISARSSDLLLQMPGRPDVLLQPIFSDAFAGGAVNVVKFSREASGAITGFTVNARGARGLRFNRLNR